MPASFSALAQLRGHGAQVLADDHAAVAPALAREHPEQVLERIVHVAAFVRLVSRGNPVKPRERHDVVEAQRAAPRHVGAQQLDERRIACGAQRTRRVRRQTPVLPARIEFIGRRADRGVDGVGLAVGPHLGAAAVGAQREIEVEADRHAELLRAALDEIELLARVPLQIGVKMHALFLRLGEAAHRRR